MNYVPPDKQWNDCGNNIKWNLEDVSADSDAYGKGPFALLVAYTDLKLDTRRIKKELLTRLAAASPCMGLPFVDLSRA